MKAAGAIATAQAAQTFVITPTVVWGATFATRHRLAGARVDRDCASPRPVVLGNIPGLGFGFMIEGAKMMAQNWWVGGAALLGTALLLTNRVIPAMFLLLLFGAVYGIATDPTLLAALRENHPFPHRPVIENWIATSTGLMTCSTAVSAACLCVMGPAEWLAMLSSERAPAARSSF